jgi:deazaflavin-dependent oxidoreductase (nitroreductase family)
VIEIWFTARAHGGDAEDPAQTRYYVIAEHGENASWVRNLRANPEVTVRVSTRTLAGRARVLDAQAEPELWGAVRARSEEKYGWGDGLVVEITPAD